MVIPPSALPIIALLAAGPAAAQNNPVEPRQAVAIEACRAIQVDAERLACFDREASAFVRALRSGNLSVVDRADMRNARRSLFGFSLPKLPFFTGDKSAEEPSDQLISSVRFVQPLANDRYRITIADGDAVWETVDTPMRFTEPKRGERIVIRKASLGSYFLSVGNQLGVKGRRIK